MRFFYSTLLALLLAGSCFAQNKPDTKPAGVPPYTPSDRALHDTIARLDSILFEAYNTCKIGVFEDLFSDSIEFYHDRGGLNTSKASLLEALKKNICGKVTRTLLPGSIEVYGIPGYGAIQMGAHRFTNKQEPADAPFHYSKFVHTWKRENGKWKVTRVISLH